MVVVAVIPARYGSSRFPGKPLVKLNGVSMVERVYRQAEKAGVFARILVATDCLDIVKQVRAFGGDAIMTSPKHGSGSERIWEAIRDLSCDSVVNVQGDEPLVAPPLLGVIADCLRSDPTRVYTAARKNESHDAYISPHNIKVVLNHRREALYFSRSPIPHMTERKDFRFFYHHYGIYGYSKSCLRRYVSHAPTPLESTEKLEQLRFLEMGIPVQVELTREESVGVDVPEDVIRVEKLLAEREKSGRGSLDGTASG